MDLFFKQTSVTKRGSLYNIKEVFNHRNVKQKVMEDFQHVHDFISVTTLFSM